MKVLHQKILNENWIMVMELLELESHAQEAREPYNGDLPLHMALNHGAPIDIIKAFIGLYPDALSQKDSNGMIPLHVATKAKAENDVLTTILLAHPEGLEVRDNVGLLPKQYEAARERAELFCPRVCWETYIRKGKKFDHNEDMLKMLEARLEDIYKYINLNNRKVKALRVRYSEVCEMMKGVTSNSTQSIECYLLKFETLHQEVDNFIDDVNSRMEYLNSNIEDKAEKAKETKSEYVKQQCGDTKVYKALRPLMDQLQVETRELTEIMSRAKNASSYDRE